MAAFRILGSNALRSAAAVGLTGNVGSCAFLRQASSHSENTNTFLKEVGWGGLSAKGDLVNGGNTLAKALGPTTLVPPGLLCHTPIAAMVTAAVKR